jgi:chaperonin cofactor prefoldin
MVTLSLEERVARIEGILEQMDKRLNHIESDIIGLRAEIRELRSEMYSRFDDLRGEMNSRFDSLRDEMNNRFREMNERFNTLERRFDGLNSRFDSFLKWIIGLILGMWTSIMITLIPILLKILGVI